MRVLAFATFLLLARSATSCDPLTGNVDNMDPDQVTYALDEQATLTCQTNYIVSWAASAADNSAQIKCGATDTWAPEPSVDGLSDAVECVECNSAVSCTEGTCNAGVCACNDGYEKSDSDPRLCTLIVQCPVLTLNNQAVDAPGPYNPTTAVVVTCSTGYFVDGEADNTVIEQTVTCNQGGAFDVILKPCVACADGISACTDGTCSAGVCDCNDGYEKSDSDPSLCTLIQCPVLTLNNQAVDVTGPYNPTTAVVVTCSAGYFVDGEADNTLTVQTVTCNQGGAFDVILKPCVACADGISACTDGTCNTGVCECNDGYEKSDSSNPSVCTLIQCPELTLTNQAADAPGPYDPTTAVVVTCSTGYFVDGEADNTVLEQTVTCNQGGAFDVDLKPCVACADGISACTDGTCNAGVCECNDGYEKSDIDAPSVCTIVQCAALTGLTHQTVAVDGPYDYNTVVTVTCADGYYVGEVGTADQILTCASSGDLEPALEACVENPECDVLDGDVNVQSMTPYSPTYSYKDGAKAAITCSDNYIISWASSKADVVGNVECDAGSFVPDPVDSFAGTVGCVACVDNIAEADCVDGTCTNGVCVCNANYKKSLADPRLCTIIQCKEFTLSNQAASEDGPYDVDAVVTVTCTDGYHVSGDLKDVDVQTLTCGSDGYFDAVLKDCVVCADSDDCTDGTCNSNKICECDKDNDYKLKEGDLNVCEKVTCPENYCAHGGECSVKLLELECDCPLGTTGDTCGDFTSDPCSPDPCKNGATCSRVLTDPVDFTTHECTCTDAFNGDSCEFANNFHIGVVEKGIEILDTSVNSVEFEVVTASGVGAMYIALLKVDDNDGNEYKVLLLKSDKSTLSLNVIGEKSLPINELTLDGTAVTAKIHVNDENKLQLDVAGQSVFTELTVNAIKALAMGGTGCAWNDASCSFGTSRIVYHSFVGHFGAVSISEEKKTFGDISSISANTAVASTLDCATYTCENSGVCDSSSGQISCSCPAGFTGFDCGTFNGGVSFNGYTSDFSFGATNVPIVDGDQTVLIDFRKTGLEIGEMANINIGRCNIILKAAGGTTYKVGDTDVEVKGNEITMTLDGTDVRIGGEVVMPCVLEKSDLSAAVTALLGGVDPGAESKVTLQDSRYQGCISKIAVNGMDIMQITAGNVNNTADTAQCIRTLNPENPCGEDSNPCLNNGDCSVVVADYSATCACTNVPYTVGETCTRQAFCASGHTCSENSTCTELDSISDCEAAIETKEGLKCGEGDRWYYYCSCKEGWQGDDCNVEIDPTPEPVKEGNDTTTIIVVVVVVAVVLGVVATIIIVKKRRSGAGNGTTNGKAEGTYSPQAQEKDLEMSGKIDEGTEDPKNIYDDIDVIKNPNAESAEPEDLPPAPADTAITVEASAPEPAVAEPAVAPAETPAAAEPVVVEPAVAVEPGAPATTTADDQV